MPTFPKLILCQKTETTFEGRSCSLRLCQYYFSQVYFYTKVVGFFLTHFMLLERQLTTVGVSILEPGIPGCRINISTYSSVTLMQYFDFPELHWQIRVWVLGGGVIPAAPASPGAQKVQWGVEGAHCAHVCIHRQGTNDAPVLSQNHKHVILEHDKITLRCTV